MRKMRYYKDRLKRIKIFRGSFQYYEKDDDVGSEAEIIRIERFLALKKLKNAKN